MNCSKCGGIIKPTIQQLHNCIICHCHIINGVKYTKKEYYEKFIGEDYID